MMWPFSWGRAYARHLETEIAWLREELWFQRDENGRLNNVVMSLKHGMTISTNAPATPRTVETTVRSAADVAHDEEFHGAGRFDDEPAPRGVV